MPNPDQIKDFPRPDSKLPISEVGPDEIKRILGSDVKKYLEEAWGFYFNQHEQKSTPETAREVAGFEILLRDINAHTERGDNWKDDDYLVRSIERFIRERFEKKIKEKQAIGDNEAVKYYQKRLEGLLEDLHRKG